jgi:hypothetical protein
MDVIDIDPSVLRKSADAALHASEQSTVHVDAECKDVVPEIIDTLVQNGPLAYCVMKEYLDDGSVKLPFATTIEGIHEAYEIIHGTTQVLGMESVVEIRGEWYTFHEGIVGSLDKATGETRVGETIALFPCTTGKGITGELTWRRKPPAELGLGAPAKPGSASMEDHGWEARRAVLRQHDRYLNALKIGDVDGILEVISDDAQTAFRDYVNETGTLIGLTSKDALRSYYEALFAKYEIVSAELLRRVAREWYVFSEIRMTVRPRGGADAGQTLAFHTAEFFAPAHDGRFVARIGHGTDPA